MHRNPLRKLGRIARSSLPFFARSIYRPHVHHRRLLCEALEDRRLLSVNPVADPPAHTIFLTDGGDLNGQTVDASNYWIGVEPGEKIKGTIRTNIECRNSPGAIVPYGYTATWGNRVTQPVESHRWLGPRFARLDLAIDKTAPTESGDYYLPISFQGSYTIAQVFSATHAGGPRSGCWYDGNDVGWDWTTADWEQAREHGYVTQQLSLGECGGEEWVTAHVATSWVGVRVRDPVVVTAFSPTASGFAVEFSETIDPSVLNLYDVESGVFGPADVTLVGDALGTIEGSLVVEENQVTFVATGGPLPADTYTVTLRSAEDAFKRLDFRQLLDGEWPGSEPGFPSGDGIPGGDFVYTFTVDWPAIYATDFSSDPGWITANTDRFHWRPSDETYYANPINVDRGGYYAYQEVDYRGGDFCLRWDMVAYSVDYACDLNFGMFDATNISDSLEGISDSLEGQWFRVAFTTEDRGRTVVLSWAKGSDHGAISPMTPQWSPNVWYSIVVKYDAAASTLDASITVLGTGEPLASLHLDNVGPFDAEMNRIGHSKLRPGRFQVPGAQSRGAYDSVTFSVPPVVVSLPDFARGPGQPVNIPPVALGGEGLPIRIENAAGATSVYMKLSYDPELLTITEAMLGPDAPEGSMVMANLETPGEVTLAFYSLMPLWSGPAEIITLDACVPAAAEYGAAHVLDITELEVNAGLLAATPDDGIHVVAFPGDANKNERYDPEDARLVARVGLGFDTGFAAFPPEPDPPAPAQPTYPVIDPLIIGDVTGDGTLSPLDSSHIMEEVVGMDSEYIPPLPVMENAVPVADEQQVTTDEDTGILIQLTGDDGDCEVEQSLTFAIDTDPTSGTLSGFDPATGTVTYTPDPDYNGVLYTSDFSVDPELITNNSTRLYWDSATETYYASQVNIDGGGYYAYREVDYRGQSFRLEWDMLPTSVDYAADTDFGMFDSTNITCDIGGQFVKAGFHTDDGGRTLWLAWGKGADFGAVYSTAPQWSPGTWYTIVLGYDSAAATLHAEITVRDTGAPVASLDLSNVEPFDANMNRLGSSGVRLNGNYQVRGAEWYGQIDNVSLTSQPWDDYFTYRVRDDDQAGDPVNQSSDLATVSFSITPVNDRPTGDPQNVTFPEDTPTPITLTGDDEDPEVAQVLTFVITDQPDHGTLTPPNQATGEVTYTPFGGYVGPDSFAFMVVDDNQAGNPPGLMSAEATVSITVEDVNDPPSFTPGPDEIIDEDAGAQTVGAWATDISPGPPSEAGQALDFIVSTDHDDWFSAPPAIGPATGDLTYTPADDACGVVTVTVQLHDDGGTANGGNDTSAPETFTITINCVNDSPSFTPGPDQTVNEDAGGQTVAAWATNISPGADNESGQVLDFIVTTDNDGLFSVLPAIDPTSGDLTYTPADDANGSATVTVTLHDDGGTANGGSDTSAPETFTISVNAVNDAPSFTKGADESVNEDAGPQTVPGWATNISSGPPDESAQVLDFIVTTDNDALFSALPAIDPGTGNLTYTPADHANGTATVTVELHDDGGTVNGGEDTSAPQTFVITVNAVNDAPAFTGGPNQTVNEDAGPQTVGSWATGISPGPVNETGQVLDFIVSTDNDGLFSALPAIDPDSGDLTYTPADKGNGSATVTVELHDNGGTANGGDDTSDPQTFVITVNPINDRPTADPQNLTTPQDTPLPITLTGDDGDPEVSQNLTYAIDDLPQHGDLSDLVLGRELTYTPHPGYVGPDSFTFQVVDDNQAGPPANLVSQPPAMISITVGSPLLAGGDDAADSMVAAPLSEEDVLPILDAALARWAAAGLAAEMIDTMAAARFVIMDLPGMQLGLATIDTIYVDHDAAGRGWFVDPTPSRDEEFARIGAESELQAISWEALDRMDLLSVVEHELGHLVGLEDLDSLDSRLMTGTLGEGVRRGPTSQEIEAVFATGGF